MPYIKKISNIQNLYAFIQIALKICQSHKAVVLASEQTTTANHQYILKLDQSQRAGYNCQKLGEGVSRYTFGHFLQAQKVVVVRRKAKRQKKCLNFFVFVVF